MVSSVIRIKRKKEVTVKLGKMKKRKYDYIMVIQCRSLLSTKRRWEDIVVYGKCDEREARRCLKEYFLKASPDTSKRQYRLIVRKVKVCE